MASFGGEVRWRETFMRPHFARSEVGASYFVLPMPISNRRWLLQVTACSPRLVSKRAT